MCGAEYIMITLSAREHQTDVPVDDLTSEQERVCDSYCQEWSEYHSAGVLHLFDEILLDTNAERAFPFGCYLLAYRAAECRFIRQTLPCVFVEKLPLDVGCSTGDAADDNVAATFLDVPDVAVELLLIPVGHDLADLLCYFLLRLFIAELLDDTVDGAEHDSCEQCREHAVAEEQRGSEHELKIAAAHSSDKHENEEHHGDNSEGDKTLIPGGEHFRSPRNEERRDAEHADGYAAPVGYFEVVDVYAAEYYKYGEQDARYGEFP